MKIIEGVKKIFNNDPDYTNKEVTEEEKQEIINRLRLEISRIDNKK